MPHITDSKNEDPTSSNTPLTLRRMRALALRATHFVGSVTDETLGNMEKPIGHCFGISPE